MNILRRAYSVGPYLTVFAAGAFLYRAANNIDMEQASGRIGPGAWPKLIILMMLATAGYGIVSRLVQFPAFEGAVAETEGEPEDIFHQAEIHPFRVWAAILCTAGYVAALPFLGFFISTIIIAFALMYLGSFRSLLPTAVLSVAAALFFMFVFMRVVYVPLPLGVPPFDELSYRLMALMGVH